MRCLVLVLAFLIPFAASAAGGAAAPIAEVGLSFMSGDAGKSLTKSYGYYANFRAESRKGYFRPHVAAELMFGSGKASVNEEEPAYRLFGGGFLPGVHIFVFQDGRIQPFFGGSGVLNWHQLALTGPPDGVEENTQGFSFGYEASAGVDIRTGSSAGTAFRIRTSLWNLSSSLGGVSGFQLYGFRVTIGLVW